MKNDNAAERAVALVHEAFDMLQRAENAPHSPVNTFLLAEQRRKFRRAAKRLREQKTRPRYENLHTAEELADIYERTAQRDEILEQVGRDLKRITQDLERVVEGNVAEVEKAMETFAKDVVRSAEEHGPGSEAALRYQFLRMLAWLGHRSHEHQRRGRVPAPLNIPLEDPTVEARYQVSAAEVLDTPPSSGEAVIDFPPEERYSGRGCIFLRIGIGEGSWIGSFEIGHMSVSTISMMPDDKHLFVSAQGAGYIIDLKSRTLVEEIGTDVAGVWVDDRRTAFVVNHDGMSLEAFGRTGRLWKTGNIGSERFRRIDITDTRIIGEARHSSPPGWVGFSVKLATGEVRFPDVL
jgi:hypothetical protein